MKYSTALRPTNHINCYICFGVVLLTAVSTTAIAASFYVVVDEGQSSFDNRCTYQDLTCATTATAIRIGVGQRFSPNFGIEMDYGALGNRKISGIFGGVPVTGNEKLTAFQFDFIRSVPLGDSFSFFGKLGGAIGQTNYTYYFGGTNGIGRSTGPGWSGGLGAQYDVSKMFAVRTKYEHFGFWSSLRWGDVIPPFSLVSAGIVLKF